MSGRFVHRVAKPVFIYIYIYSQVKECITALTLRAWNRKVVGYVFNLVIVNYALAGGHV